MTRKDFIIWKNRNTHIPECDTDELVHFEVSVNVKEHKHARAD